MTSLRLGTRGSKLALAQSTQIAQGITKATGVSVELVVISTRGDRIQNKPLAEIGGKGLFTMELEAALRDGSIDFAVHSLKDLPTDDPKGLCLPVTPKRADPRDVWVGAANAKRVGTGSLRRGEQIQNLYPSVEILGIRGNVDTRLAKLDRGDYDAIILAAAGMARLGIHRTDASPLPIGDCVPAPAQGVLGIQAREGDTKVHNILQSIHDPVTAVCVEVERSFLASIQGGCNVAAGCCVRPVEGGFQIDAYHKGTAKESVSFFVSQLDEAHIEIINRLNS
ncbi:MAG: hydroxymethylbilane synthase [Deltaproteobacteria bacterium]|nr:hydroxymethylbilane synthase [Deltaproteobacteria bacterium]